MEDQQVKQEEFVDWKAKAEEYLAGWKRAMADYQNREKELAREKQEFAALLATAVVADFLPPLDALSQTVVHIPEEQKESAWVKGIVLVQKQFADSLRRHGVAAFASVGERFDPSRHEAVGEETGEEGKVVRELAAGYEANGRVLRPAKVIVGRGST